ncbi:MAG: tRNA lysidine(34) synthetase TilS [Holosporales bacterium]|nr:tRNA lysidine(34) synthetase TilS [Holosporales bacterium]
MTLGEQAGLAQRTKIAIAVSGGSDSLALLLLTHRWNARFGYPLIALTVDHHLRPESTQEAQYVQTYAHSLRIPHRTLSWTPLGDLPHGHLEHDARNARYALLATSCWQEGCTLLLLGHTQEDQIETLLLRAFRESGAFGLAGMNPLRFLHARLALLRPLLAIPRQDLQQFLSQQSVSWISDPHNENRSFERVRVRQALKQSEITTCKNLLFLTKFYAIERRFYTQATLYFLQKHASFSDFKGRIDSASFCRLSRPLQCYILRRVISCVGGKRYPPNETMLDRSCQRLISSSFLRLTLGLTVITKNKSWIIVTRESRNLPAPLCINPKQLVCWDGRFWLYNTTDTPCWIHCPMGEAAPFASGVFCVATSLENILKIW